MLYINFTSSIKFVSLEYFRVWRAIYNRQWYLKFMGHVNCYISIYIIYHYNTVLMVGYSL